MINEGRGSSESGERSSAENLVEGKLAKGSERKANRVSEDYCRTGIMGIMGIMKVRVNESR